MDARVGLRHLVPSASTWVEVPHTRAARERVADEVRRLPPGAPVVLADRRFGSRRRSRELAQLAAVEVDRELLAIPSIDAPDFVVDDDPLVIAGFWRGFVTVPPGAASTAPVLTLAIRVVEAFRAWSVVCLVIPGRYTVGRRAG
jgi:hypothetical protein